MVEFAKVNPDLSKLASYFEEKVKIFFDTDGTFNMEYFENTACYYCNSDKPASGFYDKYGFKYMRCAICGMVYVNPRLKKDIAHNLYSEDDYAQFYKIKLLPSLDYRRDVLGVNKYNQIIELLNKDKGRVLDIGCGLGELLSVFKKNGWDTLGIEFNHFAARYAKENFGIPVINQSIYDFDEKDKFDVIMLWGVLEHLYDPRSILHRCHSLLSSDGILVLEVPSADSLLVRYAEATNNKVDRIIEGDRHLMLFSIASFRKMLQMCGFACRRLLSNGLDIATINRLFMKQDLTDQTIDSVQAVLDESMQGDLLRGFFNKI